MLCCSFRQIVLDRSVKFNTLFETVTQCVGKILLFWFCEGSACVSLSWSDGLCRDTAKLSDELRSSGMSGQDVKGRLFGCLFMVVVSSNRLAYNGGIKDICPISTLHGTF